MPTLLPGLCLLLATVSSAPEMRTPALLAGVVLRDQHGRSDSLAAHAGRPQVVLLVALRRLRRLKAWEVELVRRVEGMDFLRVADVVSEEQRPAPSLEEVAATLRRRVPAEVSVLIDGERQWAKALALDTREVNVLVFDAEGALVARLRGSPTTERLQETAAALLRQPGVRKGTAAARP